MDSFEWNKIAGAVLGTLLFVVAVRIAIGFVFTVPPPAKPGYVVQGVTVAAGTGTTKAAAAVEQLPDWGAVLPKASVAHGKEISHRCQQCHDLSKGGPNKIGPNLWGVVGRPRASHPGFDYSSAMKAKGGAWSYDELFKFLKSPQAYIPGTKMTFAGLPSANDRIDLIAYLRTDMDTPMPIPPPQPVKKAAAAPKGGEAPAATPAADKGVSAAKQGPNGTATVAGGNKPPNGNAANGSAAPKAATSKTAPQPNASVPGKQSSGQPPKKH